MTNQPAMTDLAAIVSEMREAVESGEPMKFRFLTEWADRIESAMQEREGWRPIETAPYDVPVLVHDAPWGVLAATKNDDGEWFACALGCSLFKPNHWMPLPSAPGARSQSDHGKEAGRDD